MLEDPNVIPLGGPFAGQSSTSLHVFRLFFILVRGRPSALIPSSLYSYTAPLTSILFRRIARTRETLSASPISSPLSFLYTLPIALSVAPYQRTCSTI